MTNKYLYRYVRIPTTEGYKYKKIYATTQDELEKKVAEAERLIKEGITAFNDRTTFAVYARKWVQLKHKDKETVSRLEKHIIPIIGHLVLSDIKPSHCETVLEPLASKSQSGIDKTYMLMKAILRSAVNDELILRNPMDRVDKPKGTAGKRRALTAKEQRMMIQVFQSNDRYLPFAITLGCGLRPGEVRALSWANITLSGDRPQIKVTGAVKVDTAQIGPPKSDSGYRVVPIPNWLLPLLLAYKERTNGSMGLLFPSKGRPNTPFTAKMLDHRWDKLLQDIDAMQGTGKLHAIDHSITCYYLRHTFCTNLIASGVSLKTVQYLMGHADISMTARIYAHVTEDMINDAGEAANSYYEKLSISI